MSRYCRLTDNDKHFGPFDLGERHAGWRPVSLVLESGDDEYKGYALGLAQKDRAQEAPEGLTAKEMQAHWDAQRTYHGGEPFKLGHLEFGRAVAAATIAKVKPS